MLASPRDCNKTINFVNESHLLIWGKTTVKTYTTTAREPSIYTANISKNSNAPFMLWLLKVKIEQGQFCESHYKPFFTIIGINLHYAWVDTMQGYFGGACPLDLKFVLLGPFWDLGALFKIWGPFLSFLGTFLKSMHLRQNFQTMTLYFLSSSQSEIFFQTLNCAVVSKLF